MNEILLALEIANRVLLLVEKLRVIGRQSGELTPQQDAALDAKIDDMFRQAHWQGSTTPPPAP